MNKLTLNVFLALIDETAGSLVHVSDPGARAAMGSLYEMRLLLIAEGMINGSEPSLPRMIDPTTGAMKTTTRVRTIDVGCPTCHAKPHQECWRMTTRGTHAQPTEDKLVDHNTGKRMFHKSRTAAAKARSQA